MSDTQHYTIAAVYTSSAELLAALHESERSTRDTASIAVLSALHPSGTRFIRDELERRTCTGLHIWWSHDGHADSHVYYLGAVGTELIDDLAEMGIFIPDFGATSISRPIHG
jgi:hypothetical protein